MYNISLLLQYGNIAGEVLSPVLLTILGFAVLLTSSFLVIQNVRKDDSLNYDNLNDDESDIIELLKENENKIKQKDISDKLGWDDTKTSRLTSSLVENGFLEKKREDRENYLILNE